jgi:ribonuclease HI
MKKKKLSANKLPIPSQIYTDGGLLSVNPSDIGGTWAWVAVDAEDRKIGWKSGVVTTRSMLQHGLHRVSNIIMEHVALIKAMEAVPLNWSGTILSDCQPVLTRVISDYEISKGFKRMPASELNLPEYVSKRQKEAVKRLGKVRFVLVQGHPTKADLACGIGKKRNLPVSKWNVLADDLCNQEKSKFREREGVLI